MNHIMTKEESYAERRKLFKDIWETSMVVNEKDDIMRKPKIIKTLRLDEIDRTVAGKKKKQKIKNLRTVCNKLLDFCDRQDADDLFYEQMASQEKAHSKPVIETDIKKKKQVKLKRKIKKANSMFSPKNEVTVAKAITSERKEDFLKEKNTSRYTSPMKFKRTAADIMTKKVSKSQMIPRIVKTNNLSGDGTTLQKKIVKEKRSKRKKTPIQLLPPGPTLHLKSSSYRKKRLLCLNTVYIS